MGQTTIKDVARRAGVSFQTVSLVLNHPQKVARTTRETIETAMRDLDFVPSLAARSLRKKPSRSIACVFAPAPEPAADGSRPGEETDHGRVLQTFGTVTDQQGYTLVHRCRRGDDPDGPGRIASLVSEARVDGLVVFAEGRDDPLIGLLQAKRCPFVVFGLDVPGTHYAARAERDAIHGAVRHLIAAGSRSICLLTGDARRPAADTERFRGYRDALAEAGLPLRDALVVPCDGTAAGGYQAARALLETGPGARPDAVVAASDGVALGALRALHEAGVRVPAEIRVVGFDNLAQGAYAVPSLTSVDVPVLDMVRFAFATLVELIEGTRAPDDLAQKLFPTRLVVRESSAAAPS
ncbi:DNA-binding LacI/PurR family transcriptional regulator [Methylobacterium sp. PvP062]|uniref:LacI family transcriptional regulator n=1 Tax=Methylobacterium radiotolerans TaxID=31998 RepID=A0ABV2N8U7_9HYPH|nr:MULTISPECIES: LacI family DNA-binding transcriptional regulator [unclassified Methylobacterium]MBP2493861.1 LacI family transcriptional regulator [Methylobacterium sp. PvP105]MBP2499765.1 LacI family transcriptional regulator [Methylobacterium sp. PvP109]MCX7335272.1 LacI family DNA-binding transcriptional regulator [Hyphomicrobiales bacterium]